MTDPTSNSKWKQLSTQLFWPLSSGTKIHPFSLQQYALDHAIRNRETIDVRNRSSNEQRISALALHNSRVESAAALTKQPTKLAVATWESEGGAMSLKSPRE